MPTSGTESVLPEEPERRYRVRAQRATTKDWRRLFDHVRLEISVGQDYHEGGKLRAVFAWAAQQKNFKTVSLIIGDLSKRFNIMFETGVTEERAYAEAERQGDLWLERNVALLKAYPHFKVTRWKDWVTHPSYSDVRRHINHLYKTDKEFRLALDRTVATVFCRRNYWPERFEVFRFLSRRYLLEEVAVCAVAYNELGGISAYPGSFIGTTWGMFLGKDISGVPDGLKCADHHLEIHVRPR